MPATAAAAASTGGAAEPVGASRLSLAARRHRSGRHRDGRIAPQHPGPAIGCADRLRPAGRRPDTHHRPGNPGPRHPGRPGPCERARPKRPPTPPAAQHRCASPPGAAPLAWPHTPRACRRLKPMSPVHLGPRIGFPDRVRPGHAGPHQRGRRSGSAGAADAQHGAAGRALRAGQHRQRTGRHLRPSAAPAAPAPATKRLPGAAGSGRGQRRRGPGGIGRPVAGQQPGIRRRPRRQRCGRAGRSRRGRQRQRQAGAPSTCATPACAWASRANRPSTSSSPWRGRRCAWSSAPTTPRPVAGLAQDGGASLGDLLQRSGIDLGGVSVGTQGQSRRARTSTARAPQAQARRRRHSAAARLMHRPAQRRPADRARAPTAAVRSTSSCEQRSSTALGPPLCRGRQHRSSCTAAVQHRGAPAVPSARHRAQACQGGATGVRQPHPVTAAHRSPPNKRLFPLFSGDRRRGCESNNSLKPPPSGTNPSPFSRGRSEFLESTPCPLLLPPPTPRPMPNPRRAKKCSSSSSAWWCSPWWVVAPRSSS